MALSPEAKQLLALLRRGETVSRHALGSWITSGGQPTVGSAVFVLVKAGLAEYFEWGVTRWRQRVGTAARLKPRTEQEAA